ncbi:hypothetical protein QYF36_002391 [Acer negundo]|nr:hypothetical protein QYF36_002391 [Acer negundo]
MYRVGRPHTRLIANLGENLTFEKDDDQGENEAESHPYPYIPQPQVTKHREKPMVPKNTIKRAYKVGATNFDGTGDPNSASSWLNELECVFGVMRCTDEQKISFAIFLLKEKVDRHQCNKELLKGLLWIILKGSFMIITTLISIKI